MKTPETIEKSMLKSILTGVPFRDWFRQNGKRWGKTEKTQSNLYGKLKKQNLPNISKVEKEVSEAVIINQKEQFKITLEHKAQVELMLLQMVQNSDSEGIRIKAAETLAKFNGWNAPTLKAIDFIDNTPKEKEQKHIIFIKK